MGYSLEVINMLNLVIFVSLLAFVTGNTSTVCGEDSNKVKFRKATDEIIKRFMGSRNPDWGWENPSTAIALQICQPKRFFGREKTAKAFETRVSKDLDKFDVNTKGAYAVAAKALCMNERNISGIDLVQNIADELDVEFSKVDVAAISGKYNMGIAALCLCGYQIKPDVVEKILKSQNSDGSFGTLEETMWFLPIMECLSSMSHQKFNVGKVKKALSRMREFVISKIKGGKERDEFIKQDEQSFMMALIGLWISKKPYERPARWNCKQMLKKIGVYPKEGESERSLVFRLYLIHGTGHRGIENPNFGCTSTDPIPEGYEPTCDKASVDACKPKPEPKK